MARPTKPKDLKPKAEGDVAAVPAPGAPGGAAPAFDLKYIVLIVVIVLASVLGSAASTYLIGNFILMEDVKKTISHLPTSGEAGGEHGEEAEGEEGHGEAGGIGMNLELDEFTVNLKQDTQLGGNQFLRAKMALSVKVPDAENCYLQQAAPHAYAQPMGGGKIVGAAAPVDRTTVASGGAPAGPTCEDTFKTNMSKFVPTIRDVINAALMKRTASSLASLEGQESLKDEIKEQLTQLMAPNYEIQRVNFQDFIIQR